MGLYPVLVVVPGTFGGVPPVGGCVAQLADAQWTFCVVGSATEGASTVSVQNPQHPAGVMVSVTDLFLVPFKNCSF